MTVQTELCKVVYIADGETVSFSVPFYFFEADLDVFVDADSTPLAKGVDYTISGAGDYAGGAVVFASAPQNNKVITIVRNVAMKQLVSFMEGEKFPAADYERALDRIVMALQQLKAKLSDCIAIPYSFNISADEVMQTLMVVAEHIETIQALPEMIEDIEEAQGNISTLLDDYDTKSEVSSKISTALADYDDSTEVSSKISTALADYDDSSAVTSKINTTLASYDTSSTVSSKISTALADYDDSSSVTSKINTALASYDTSSTVSSKISTALTDYDDSSAVTSKINTALASYDTSSTVNSKIAAAKPLCFSNVSGLTTACTVDNTYQDYPYRLDVTLTGVTADMIPHVHLSLSDAISGKFAPIAASYSGGISLFLTEALQTNITIPSIVVI